ncbi:acyltransferase domain-containing protein [Actinopolymorpha alba]|uniref:acyltransferase domain-containing protein n=1 Tax=Actinopolymorpha alba TaxID=533267 RepID=UPI00037B8DC1|nr:acyltransferase domain-containing protein [Actinopolymorpha alba]
MNGSGTPHPPDGASAEVRWVHADLGLDESHRTALMRLAKLGPPAEPVRLPPPTQCADLLQRLGVAPPDIDEALAARPSKAAHPGMWWLLERCHHELVQHMGRPGSLGGWPALPETHGAVGRYFYVWVYLATLPFVRRYHAERGIPDETSWEILAALGAQLANRRALFGTGGLHTHEWMTVHFRGLIYALGRLYFERLPIWFDAEDRTVGRRAPRRGEWSLGVHIPEGRLTPEACDASFDRARGFFREHFPDEAYRHATCVSWVLDPQLEEYLSPTTNIIRFQKRFSLLPAGEANDNATVVEFVFRRPLTDLGDLPQETTLQRGIVEHIRAGRTWKFRTGWIDL